MICPDITGARSKNDARKPPVSSTRSPSATTSVLRRPTPRPPRTIRPSLERPLPTLPVRPPPTTRHLSTSQNCVQLRLALTGQDPPGARSSVSSMMTAKVGSQTDTTDRAAGRATHDPSRGRLAIPQSHQMTDHLLLRADRPHLPTSTRIRSPKELQIRCVDRTATRLSRYNMATL